MRPILLLHAGGSNLVPGPGPKRDCALWEQCINAWVRTQGAFGIDADHTCEIDDGKDNVAHLFTNIAIRICKSVTQIALNVCAGTSGFCEFC